MRDCDNVVALSQELGVPWRTLYKWKDEAESVVKRSEADPTAEQTRALLEANARLKAALADKVLEVQFFKGALQNIEAQRRPSSGPGGTASTKRFGK